MFYVLLTMSTRGRHPHLYLDELADIELWAAVFQRVTAVKTIAFRLTNTQATHSGHPATLQMWGMPSREGRLSLPVSPLYRYCLFSHFKERSELSPLFIAAAANR